MTFFERKTSDNSARSFRHTLAAALAAATMLTTAGAAFAAPGVTLGAVNMRDDDSLSGDIIDTLAKGTFVDIIECGGGWCAVEYDDEEGSISAKYLALVEDGDDDDDDDYDDDDDDDDDDYDDYEDDGPSVEVCVGGGGFGGGGFGFGKLCIED